MIATQHLTRRMEWCLIGAQIWIGGMENVLAPWLNSAKNRTKFGQISKFALARKEEAGLLVHT